MDLVLQVLAHFGVPGVVILGMCWWILRQDAALKVERDARDAEFRARIEDAKAGTAVALQLQAQVIDAVNKCATILDEIRRSRKEA